MAEDDKDPGVYAAPRSAEVETPSLRVPADYGFPGLGLMMQLWAGLQAAFIATSIVGTIWLMGEHQKAWPVVFLATNLVRAIVHFVAGTEVRAGGLNTLSRVRFFLYISVGAALLQLAVLASIDSPGTGWEVLSWTVLDAVAWPVMLVALTHRRTIRSLFSRLADGEVELVGRNRGIEAVGAIMIALGSTATLFAAFAFVGLHDAEQFSKDVFGDSSGFLLIGVSVFFFRGAVQTGLGIKVLVGVDRAGFLTAAKRFYAVHLGSLVLVAIPTVMAVSGIFDRDHSRYISGGHEFGFLALLAVVALTFMLSLWPTLLRSYARSVSGDAGEGGDEDDRAFGPAPDAGLVTVGWFICAYAAASLPLAVLSIMLDRPVTHGAGTYAPTWFLHDELPTWLGLVGVALATWAGVELVSLTKRARAAAGLFSVAALGAVVLSRVDTITDVWRSSTGAAFVEIGGLYEGAGALMSMLVPALVVLLVVRSVRRGAQSSTGM